MAHAGTMVGGSAQTKQSGSFWPAIALALAVVLATVGGVWLASSAALVGGTAKPAAERSYDQIEAQRGAVMLSTDAYLNGILDRAHAAPFAVGAVVVPPSPTSGTFHVRKAAEAQVIAPVKRDRVGGP